METLTQHQIERAAIEMGSNKNAVGMWRNRQMPWKWRLLLSEHFKVTPDQIVKFWLRG
jgi:thiamine biosynthesis lipoprotein ApbE